MTLKDLIKKEVAHNLKAKVRVMKVSGLSGQEVRQEVLFLLDEIINGIKI
jgi:hypothetical protein